MFWESLIKALVTYSVYMLIHDVLIKQIYCSIKKKKDNRKKCYFWNCKHWRECPYNGVRGDVKNEY